MRMTKPILLTKEGYETLTEELEVLEAVSQPENVERVKRARSFCDFNEDSEYEAALREQTRIKRRIKELQHTLRHAKVIEKEREIQRITIGSTVEIVDLETRDKEIFTIVTKEEADSLAGKISAHSPLGETLLHARLHEELEVNTPNGSWKIKVSNIR